MNLLRLKNTRHSNFFAGINLSSRKIFWIILFLFLFLIASFFFSMSRPSTAQGSTTFSGRLIDTQGNPISGITIYIRRYNGPEHNSSEKQDDSLQTVTGANGRFDFSGIVYDSLKLDIQSASKIGYQINVLSVEFGEIALYPDRDWHWSSVKFALKPGVRMENVVITADIRGRPKIRTRVVYADSTALTNTEIYVYRQTNPFVGNNRGSGQLMERTDADGYFVEYLYTVTGQPEHYITLVVEHQGLFAKAIPFVFLDHDRDLVLTLNGNPKPLTEPPLEHWERFSALAAYLEPPPMWVVNPANGHAYKKTHSQTIKEATVQATAEGAYLVAINDESEETWLQHVFGNGKFWIGLSDTEEEGQWQWHSGEPVIYTNWGTYEPEGGNSEDRDYVKTGHFGWGWEATTAGIFENPENPQNRSTHLERAILEKVAMPLRTPSHRN
ncbi:hypothetical protein F4009_23030 [Candidatus Poribacteria bacterium]|nr:hypothetical protein [Candidatus Poribacteria bacterium]MYK96832.1 hypothetical protein [Candidatus Poribacteria bacterium]